MIQLYIQVVVLQQYSKIKKKIIINDNNVQVILKETILQRNFNIIPNIPALLRKYEAWLPVVGAAGLTIIFTQTGYTVATQRTISDFNLGSVVGV